MPEGLSQERSIGPEGERPEDEDWIQLGFWPDEGVASETTGYATADLSEPHHTVRIRDMYEDDRPRQRLHAHGPKALSTAELLSLLLGTGHHTTGRSAVELAQCMLAELGENGQDAISQLRHITMEDLLLLPGVGPAKAATIVAAIELGKRAFIQLPAERTRVDDPAVAVSLLSHDLMWEQEERFAVLMLNIRHHFIAKRVLTVGSQTETIAHPREIFGEALRHRAVRIIVAHNHPSGSLEPSPDDLALTRQLLQGGKVLSLPVLDHLILGDGRFQSLRQTTSLWQEIPQEIRGEGDVVHDGSPWGGSG